MGDTPTALIATDRVIPDSKTCDHTGQIKLDPLKAAWVLGHGAIGLFGLIVYPQLGAILVFLGLTIVTICAGHSVGMHRLLIHRSFKTYRGVEYLLVWLGVLVGMAGPYGMIRTHDLRDWHQRQASCPPHPAHKAGFWRDAWWQLCCLHQLDAPPAIVIEDTVQGDPVYQLMERTWMAQQIPLAVILFAFGGWAWVCWGISARIFVSLFGHWIVGHYAHRQGHQGWMVRGVAVQGYNLPKLGLITFGEGWHGNHHAFPHSAQLGIEDGQSDLGYLLIRALRAAGMAWDIQGPASVPERARLMRVLDTHNL